MVSDNQLKAIFAKRYHDKEHGLSISDYKELFDERLYKSKLHVQSNNIVRVDGKKYPIMNIETLLNHIGLPYEKDHTPRSKNYSLSFKTNEFSIDQLTGNYHKGRITDIS